MKQLLISFLSLVIVLTTPTFGQVDSVTDQYMGNGNLLVNPGLESGLKSWTNVAGVLSVESSVVIKGKRAGKVVLSSQALNLYQDVTSYQAQLADGVQGLASIRVKTSVSGLRVCPRQAGLINSNLCVSVVANNKWGLYKVPFILGATSNGISIASTGAVTGTVYIDDAFVGAVDLSATVDQSRIAGEAYFAGTASCQWNRTSTTVGAFTTTAACPGPTIAYSSMGQWQTTDSDLPRQTINNLPAGVYKAKFIVSNFNLAATASVMGINDGTSTCEPIQVGTGSAPNSTTTLECTFTYTTSGNRVFEVYAASPSSTVTLVNDRTAPRASLKFILEYFGSGSVYSSTNADTDWASCTPTSSQGFGTPTYALQCKRQGGDLLMRGTFTPSTTTAVEARIGLPLWNGVQLNSAGSSIIPAIQQSGNGSLSTATAGQVITLIEPSVSYITFGFQTSGAAGLTKATGSTLLATGSLSLHARVPIDSWQNSNILIGQFNGLESCTNTLECTDVFSAYGTNAGVISQENVDFINGNGTVASGVFTYTFKSGVFTVAPNCVVNVGPFGASVGNYLTTINSISSSGISFNAVFNGAASAFAHQIICQKQGVDFVSKTAKAVASDQSVRSIGSTGMDLQSVYFGIGANCDSACTTGTCNICHQVGSKITSVTWDSTGAYRLNGIDGLKYTCVGQGYSGTTALTPVDIRSTSTSTYKVLSFRSGGTATNTGFAAITCTGIP